MSDTTPYLHIHLDLPGQEPRQSEESKWVVPVRNLFELRNALKSIENAMYEQLIRRGLGTYKADD